MIKLRKIGSFSFFILLSLNADYQKGLALPQKEQHTKVTISNSKPSIEDDFARSFMKKAMHPDFKLEQIFPDICLQTAIKKILKDNPSVQDLNSIQTLQLDRIKISNLKGIDKLSHLKEISLSGNYISDVVPLSWLAEIQKLDLSYNRISHPSALNRLRYLTHLNLSNNDIKYTFGCAYMNLRELDISNNKIDQLMGTKGTNLLLEIVDVSNNPLQTISTFALPSLKNFKANHTFLENISILRDCPKLEYLELENCPNFKSLDGLFSKNRITGFYICIFKNLKEIVFSEEFLSPPARKILEEIRSGKITQMITINNQTIIPEQSMARQKPTRF